MGDYKFKPDSILDFYLPSWDAPTSQAEAVSQFKNYLTFAGIAADESGYLDTDQFMSLYDATSMIIPTIQSQYKNYYEYLYTGYLYEGFSGSLTAGYVVLPFLVNEEHIKLVLPGTICSFSNCLFDVERSTQTKYRLVRTSEALNIYYASDNSLYKTLPSSNFSKGVVPFYLIFCCQGGGGGGSSQEGLVAGRGGGGGGFAAGIINIQQNPDFIFAVGGGGFGGSHASSDSSTATRHDGQAGTASYVENRDGTQDLLTAYGGKGGVAAQTGTSTATGGTAKVSSSVIRLKTGTSDFTGATGGSGLIDTNSSATYVYQKVLSIPGTYSYISMPTLYMNKTLSSGTSYNPGGAGGGACWNMPGASGGKDTANGTNALTGAGGGGGGYLLGSYKQGGAGGNGSITIYY